MYHSDKLIVVFFIVALLLTKATKSDYTVPEPYIQTFAKGFRVSVPHEEGVQLFAFHGNINQPMDGLEAGQFSKDILKKCGDKWVFQDRTTRLRPGDVIYFWLYVLRDGLGYRYDDGSFTVKDTSKDLSPLQCDNLKPQDWVFDPQNPDEHDPILDVRSSLQRTKRTSVCCSLFLNVSALLTQLEEQNQQLETRNLILTELAQKDPYFSKSLRLFGKYQLNYGSNPLEFVSYFVKEKLRLDDVVVTEATAIPDHGISFKVDSLEAKVQVIMASKTILSNSQYEIVW